ncbi:glycosyl transferase family 2 [Microbispora sp. NEAU-D428]|uniref:glycosyltransferase n=1 Tax=Microbispora sitophila TaxID=2771537 RepID=UPI001869409A|nr:glycosyl transferase family 2 [Microbispora sitophila]MBE3013761.1 glycosyl transferase family 2 [Microbispora sitophila]
MTRTATRSAWGTWIGFESCPTLLGRLVEGFAGPWTPLQDVPVPDLGTAPMGDADASRDATRDATRHAADAIGCVVLAARSPGDLRRAVPLRGLLPIATRVRIALADVPSWAAQPLPVTAPGACWRHLTEMRIVRRGRGWHLDAAFTEPVPAGDVVAHVANGLFGGCEATTPVAGIEGGGTADWRPGDPNVTLSPPGGPVPDRRDAPGCDLPLRRAEADGPVVGGAVVDDTVVGYMMPPLDEAVVNPIGFRQHPSQGLAALAAHRDGFVVTLGADRLVRLPACGRVTDVDVARLRDVRGIEVPALGPQAEQGRASEVARVVAALSAAGIPVLAAPDPARDRALGPGLAAALAAVTEEALASDLRREELSIRLRRAALREHGAAARWRRLALAAGLPVPPHPRVSILLCTRRPEMVPFAVEQMDRQRGVTAELIVGLHGFTAREAAIPRTRLPVTVIEASVATPFGEVLNRMAAVASGSYLAKVDDDDWYGPDHLADLLLARRYSGADLVGSAAEFVYLEPLDVTIRRCIGTERFAPLVAGGTMLVTRAAFEAAGGFRPLARTVDGQLLQAVEAVGGRIYRTHGLGYVLRRRSAYGHTWRQPVQSFLASYQEQWRGLVFNELMEDGARWRAEVRT